MSQNVPSVSQSVQEERNRQLEAGLFLADKLIHKNYLIDLNRYEVLPLEQVKKQITFLRCFRLERLIFDPEENVNDKLVSVYSALQHLNCSVVTIIDSTLEGIRYYIGVRSEENASVAGKVLEKGFLGNFPGSILTSMSGEKIEAVMKNISCQNTGQSVKNVSSVSIIPSMRSDNKDQFVQGIEKFIDTMNGETYTAIFISRALDKATLETRKRGYEELYSILSPFVKTSLNYSENYSEAVSEGMTKNFTDSINRSISNSVAESEGISRSESNTTNSGNSWSFQGNSSSSGSSQGTSTSYSSGNSWTDSVTSGSAFSYGSGTSYNKSVTEGNSRAMTVEYQNKSVAELLKKIGDNLERIHNCEAFGLWESAAYFVAQDVQISVVAANTYKALVSGQKSSVENSFINFWGTQRTSDVNNVLQSLCNFMHPRIQLPVKSGLGGQVVSPVNMISGNEIPFMMGLPKHSVNGLPTMQIASFGRNIFETKPNNTGRKISLGKVYHMGREEIQKVELDLESLTSHCFIAGSTGSGKSNTTYCLLEGLIENQVPFMVIEPAKGEYKKVFGNLPGIHVYGTDLREGSFLRINPFRFDDAIHVLEHMDMLIEIFHACWPLQAAMPAILKSAIEEAYIQCGWDLNQSVHFPNGKNKYPTFEDLMRILPLIIKKSSYSAEAKGDYTGALVTRVSSMANGINGRIFTGQPEVEDSILFDENVIVDLSRVGSSETKALLMGILIMKLKEYRISSAIGENRSLSHVMVLEEAHNLLKRVSGATNENSSNMAAKSVEMISNSIAEMRTYGEGFFIIDQSPTAVDISAIKNTNTKIIMRLPEQGDCEAMGNALSLSEQQKKELSKLTVGIAVVFQNSWLEPVLTKVNPSKGTFYLNISKTSDRTIRQIKGKITSELMNQFENNKFNPQSLSEMIEKSRCDKYWKEELMVQMKYFMDSLVGEQELDRKKFGKYLVDFINCRQLLSLTPIVLDMSRIEKEESINDQDIKQCQEWQKMCMINLTRYVALNDEDSEKLLHYIVLAAEYFGVMSDQLLLAYYVLFGRE